MSEIVWVPINEGYPASDGVVWRPALRESMEKFGGRYQYSDEPPTDSKRIDGWRDRITGLLGL